MNRIAIGAISSAFILFASILPAQVPQLINYQGRIVVGSTNFNGTGSFKFALVDAAGTTAYWTNDGTHLDGTEPTNAVSISVSNGLYSVLLGDTSLGATMTAVPAIVFNNADVRLRVWFNDGTPHGSQQLTPDQRIAAVGYAVIAGNVSDGAITSAKIANGSVGTAQIASGAIGSSQIASGAVGTTQIANGAVTATQIGGAQVVKSLNSLQDNVTLAAGANVTISPSGNTLTIASSGATIWNLNGTDTYYTAGKVGIGTNAPNHRLSIAGGPLWTSNQWKGSIDLDYASAIGWQGTSGGQRFGIGQSGGGLYFFRTTSDPGTTTTAANYDMEITDSGNLLIAGGTEFAGIKLQVNGAASFASGGSGGVVQFGSPNAETGMTIIGSARADIRFDGSTLKLLAGPVGGPPSSANGVAINTAGNVGIGTTSPGAKLDVITSGDAIRGTSTGGTIGVYGLSSNTGVYGDATGSGEGVHGRSAGNGAAVNGTSTGGGTGVYGTSASGYAGYFGGNVNVTGTVSATNVRGSSTNGFAAVYGENSSSTGWSGYFKGNVFVGGNLSKPAGSFKIDHPLDPANKYLSHSFVESPDMMNIYNGVAIFDQNGEALVQLPSWFGALNRDFRYQLTCIGGFAPVYIAEEIANNQFTIAGGQPGMKVSWQVTGVRQDAYANAHRIAVEEEKMGNERGLYLHPDAFGQSADKGIGDLPSSPITPPATASK